ncbi:hypothetical protein EYF80_004434 [Liparis tanakae]|uniref:Uncharacterized protein n=1 Tax=Liparis tanakae TaxID=230148 RepID=A0A4Z2J7J9_9TELE|nr:hypothetical protein EYF80_004434 [Liparis tanakae]
MSPGLTLFDEMSHDDVVVKRRAKDTHGIFGTMMPWQMGMLPLHAHLPGLCHGLVGQSVIIC